jgi:alanine-glyoxylate transaminase/serine-glyoxylate transaminase/serine-pyruvate transaminase
MGPGPSDVDPRILTASALPTIGHLDPAFIRVMEDVRKMLKAVYGTANALTIPMSGTGSAGMETCLVNLLEPGDRALIGVNGVFGGRMVEVARRCGADVVAVEAEWGRDLHPERFTAAAGGGAFKVLALVHAETSTGVLTDLSGFREVADSVGALLLTDCVTSLGGVPVELDLHGVDAAYSGTQKCLSAPPGLSPVSFSERAVAAIHNRSTPVQSWYLDLSLIARYWIGVDSGAGTARAYHHTAPINAVYGLHEALRIVLEEGLEARYARHRRHSESLAAGLEALGLEMPVDPRCRLPQLTLVKVPDGVDEKAVRSSLLATHGLEIGGGLGAFAGSAWRIGLMGSACTEANVELCLGALKEALTTRRS